MRVWDLRTRQTLRVMTHPSKGPVTALLSLPCPSALAAPLHGLGFRDVSGKHSLESLNPKIWEPGESQRSETHVHASGVPIKL